MYLESGVLAESFLMFEGGVVVIVVGFKFMLCHTDVGFCIAILSPLLLWLCKPGCLLGTRQQVVMWVVFFRGDYHWF